MKFRVVIEQDEDGLFVASCPRLPGCHAQGPTRARALTSVREAVGLYVESLRAHGEPIPPGITEDVVEIPEP